MMLQKHAVDKAKLDEILARLQAKIVEHGPLAFGKQEVWGDKYLEKNPGPKQLIESILDAAPRIARQHNVLYCREQRRERLMAWAEARGIAIEDIHQWYKPGVYKWNRGTPIITIDSGCLPHVQAQKFLHEMGHFLTAPRMDQDRRTAEMLAESTACAVCGLAGWDIFDHSARYIADWLNRDETLHQLEMSPARIDGLMEERKPEILGAARTLHVDLMTAVETNPK
jgi:hypothetical protein